MRWYERILRYIECDELWNIVERFPGPKLGNGRHHGTMHSLQEATCHAAGDPDHERLGSILPMGLFLPWRCDVFHSSPQFCSRVLHPLTLVTLVTLVTVVTVVTFNQTPQ